MQLIKVRKIKTFLYQFEDVQEKETFKELMLAAGLIVEHESDLTLELSQAIYEHDRSVDND